MRSDIVPGGRLPNYELPDHTGKLRKLSELQGDDPLVLTLSRGHFCPKEHQQHLEIAAFTPSSPWHTHRSPRFQLTTTTLSRSFERRSEPSGAFFPIPGALFKKTSTSRSTPILNTTR